MTISEKSGRYSLALHSGDSEYSKGGIAIAGFSTVGMVGVISTSHIIRSLDLSHDGRVLDTKVPAIALVHDHVPKHPVRVHRGDGIGVFTAEIQFPPERDVEFANTVLEWFSRCGYSRLFVIDGLVRQNSTIDSGGLFAVASSSESRTELNEHEIEQIQQGVVAGIPGHLLSEGDRLGMDVIALLPECNPMYPDARASASAIQAFSSLSGINIALDDLLADAHQIEESVREVFDRAQSMLPSSANEQDPMVG